MNQQMFENVIRNVRNGQCDHVQEISTEYVSETMVTLYHIYFVVHKSDLKLIHTAPWNSFTGLSGFTLYDTATQKNNRAQLEYPTGNAADL